MIVRPDLFVVLHEILSMSICAALPQLPPLPVFCVCPQCGEVLCGMLVTSMPVEESSVEG